MTAHQTVSLESEYSVVQRAVTTMANKRLAALALTLLSASCSSEPPAHELREVAAVSAAASRFGVERTIAMHFIQLQSSSSSTLSTKSARKGVEIANEVFYKAHIQFEFSNLERVSMSKDFVTKDNVKFDRAEVQPLTAALGIPNSWCSSCSKNGPDWLEDMTTEFLGSDEMIVWVTDWGGNEVPGFEQSPTRVRMSPGSVDEYKFAHELGHAFGLRHSQDFSISCSYWDLVYFAESNGNNRFFNSKGECDLFMASADSSSYLQRIDPRNFTSGTTPCPFWQTLRMPKGSSQRCETEADDKDCASSVPVQTLTSDRTFSSTNDCKDFFKEDLDSGTTYRKWWSTGDLEGNVASRSVDGSSGAITVKLPCRGCSSPKTYSTGDDAIRGYARTVGYSGEEEHAVNVMTYYTAFPSSKPQFISEAQAAIVVKTIRGASHSSGPRTLLGRTVSDNPLRMIDVDGDDRRDIVTWDPPSSDCDSSSCPKGVFRVLQSSKSYSTSSSKLLTRDFGIKGDIPVLADYDGDGLTDLAFFRPGEWRESSSSAAEDRSYWTYCASSLAYDCARPVTKQFGLRGDVPIPGTNMYGGWDDGEAVVYRPSTGAWYYAPMCKPDDSGTTTCSTKWYGPYKLGDEHSYLLPDLWDGDETTDLAVFDPTTATLRIRRSEGDYSETLVRPMGDQYAFEEGASTVVPQYRRYWDGDEYVQRRTFAMFHHPSNTWVTRWYWWDAGSASQLCGKAAMSHALPIGGFDIDGDMQTEHLMMWRSNGSGSVDHVLQAMNPSTNSCSSNVAYGNVRGTWGYRAASAVADMTGDGRPDLLVIDQNFGEIQIHTGSTSAITLSKTIRFGGPKYLYL